MTENIWQIIYRVAKTTPGKYFPRIDFFGTVTMEYHKLLTELKFRGLGILDYDIKSLGCSQVFFEDNRQLGVHQYYISIVKPE